MGTGGRVAERMREVRKTQNQGREQFAAYHEWEGVLEGNSWPKGKEQTGRRRTEKDDFP